MPNAPSSGNIFKAFGSSLARELPNELSGKVTVGRPAEVVTPEGELSHWHVPVRHGERTVGFMDFDLDGQLVRYGSRVRDGRQLDDLPADIMDMPPADRTARAKDALNPGGMLESAAKLVADQSPTRLTWMFNGREADGTALRVYVTPQFSWSDAGEGSGGGEKE